MNKLNGIFIKNFNLKKISYFKIGGKTKQYFIPDDFEDLQYFLKHAWNKKEKFYIIGNASNILFNDKFYNGTIINLKGFTNTIELKKNKIYACASVHLDNLINFTIQNSLKGLEKLSGIPGTIGGALIMNAGAFGVEIGKHVEFVKVLTYSGKIKILKQDEINFSYREAAPLEKYIILETCLKLRKGEHKLLLNTQKKILKKRKIKQPLEYPSCGSIFKRPEHNYAGRLIEQCCLKGYQIGGARISEKHCNFIVNTNKAKANDVMELINYIKKQVYKKFKVKLNMEIKLFNF